jgi:hypothetical protein
VVLVAEVVVLRDVVEVVVAPWSTVVGNGRVVDAAEVVEVAAGADALVAVSLR